MPRPRGFIDWRPQKRTRVLLDAVLEVLAEYAEQLPLTIRQIFYRLVGREGFQFICHWFKIQLLTGPRLLAGNRTGRWAPSKEGVSHCAAEVRMFSIGCLRVAG